MFFEIKVYMSIAMVFYLLAFLSAKKYQKAHIFFAASGFIFDLYATYLMEIMNIWTKTELAFKINYLFILYLHASIATLAILAFLLQAALGISKKRKAHIFWAKYIFLPLWIAAYASGLYLLSIF